MTANEKFEAAARMWQVLLGLGDWHFTFEFKDELPGVACVLTHREQRTAHFTACTHKLSNLDNWGLNNTALHEVHHVLLRDLIAVAQNPRDDADLDREEHKFIVRSVRLLLDHPSANVAFE